MARGSRRSYAPIVNNEGPTESWSDHDDNVDVETAQTERSRRTYNRLSLEEDNDDGADAVTSNYKEEIQEIEDDEDNGERMTVTILDYTQKKFQLSVNPTANVHSLKKEGAAVHKIPEDRQRLIFRGKMLADDTLLEDAGIVEDGAIVHLFPKPRVVIKDSNEEHQVQEEEEDENAARVPTIVLDADEAERRSQILVLGSTDFLEAQNSVKLFSFMLLIISSIELMSLIAIAMGVPQKSSDTVYPGALEDDVFAPIPSDPTGNSTDPSGDGSSQSMASSQGWTIENSLDLVVSTIGVFVGLVGLRASNETTLRLAKQYLYGTVVAGVTWMLFQYLMTFELDEAEYKQKHGDEDFSKADIMQAALSVMVLPGMVWFLCVVRAWQFQYLLREAEREAEDRIQSELENIEGPASTTGNESSNEERNGIV